MATSNRLEHGFRSSTVLLPSDDPAQYEALLCELTAHFGPTDLTTERLVREMADAEWRLRRLRSHLASALARHLETVAQRHPELTDSADRESRAIETLAETGCSYSTWLRYESRFQNQYDRAYKTWTAHENDRRRSASIDAEILARRALSMPTHPQREGTEAAVSNVQTATAQQPAQTPRNAPCPCKSGEKYKRCCGRAAPPQVLRKAA
ncbi:MAG TPA: SEC-C domain-containing protein [Bryobacteraceae bacterium]|jgi:hypothetical protein